MVSGKGSIQISDTTTIPAEDELKTNCTITNKKFILSLHYNNDNSYLFINNIKQYEFKTKSNEIIASKLNLGSISDSSS